MLNPEFHEVTTILESQAAAQAAEQCKELSKEQSAVNDAEQGVVIAMPPSTELRELIGYRFWDADLSQIARYLVQRAVLGQRLQVFFVNAHCVNVAARKPAYAKLLKGSPILFADGVGLAVAARISGVPLVNNVNGTDLFPKLCEAAAASKIPVAFLGARPGVAQVCARRMERQFPGLCVTWVEHGYLSGVEEKVKLTALNSSGARILFVAKGVPDQEQWIAANVGMLAPPVVLGVGALFDFYSGAISRAPQFVRKLRMEWLYRLLREPFRLFGRYVIGIPVFIARTLRWRLIKP